MINIDKIMRLVDITASRLLDKDKEMLNTLFLNTDNLEETKKEELKTMFILWQKYVPHHKQNYNCGSCRSAVWAFWYKVNESAKK